AAHVAGYGGAHLRRGEAEPAPARPEEGRRAAGERLAHRAADPLRWCAGHGRLPADGCGGLRWRADGARARRRIGDDGAAVLTTWAWAMPYRLPFDSPLR